jgi:hypothetical protein
MVAPAVSRAARFGRLGTGSGILRRVSTTSTANLWRQVRSHILTYVPPAGGALSTRLAGQGLYYVQVPDKLDDNGTYPYGVARLIDRNLEGAYNQDRDAMALEILWAHRPRRQAETLEDIVDVCDMALRGYADSSSGLVFSRERQRTPLEPRPDPADREVVLVWTKFQLVVWPQYLTQFSPFVTS